ncbi:hypothetical protein OAS86_03390, partial [Gammaproteobacteria bacterium]|nr:hypothetical protein [Gammaproteobacteria bacterium]
LSHAIAAGEPGTYLLTCCCVRRAILCDHDHLTSEDFDHRRQWFVDRLGVLMSFLPLKGIRGVTIIGTKTYAKAQQTRHLRRAN